MAKPGFRQRVRGHSASPRKLPAHPCAASTCREGITPVVMHQSSEHLVPCPRQRQAARAAGRGRHGRDGRGVVRAAVSQQLGYLRRNPVRPARDCSHRRRLHMAGALTPARPGSGPGARPATDAAAKRSRQKDKCPFFPDREVAAAFLTGKLRPLAPETSAPVIDRNRAMTDICTGRPPQTASGG